MGCISFVAFCSRHPADLISPNYYEEEVRYQAQIDRVRLTHQQAAQASASYDALSRQVTISLGMLDAGANISGNILLYRPSAQKLDRKLELNVKPNGEQIVDGTSLQAGLWRVRVSWAVGDQKFFMDKEIVVTPKNS
jgi:hypothetical protein